MCVCVWGGGGRGRLNREGGGAYFKILPKGGLIRERGLIERGA